MKKPAFTQRFYQITVEGKIHPSWSDWLGGMQIFSRDDADGGTVTILSGPVIDQAALRGLLNNLWDLNLSLHSVEQINPNKK